MRILIACEESQTVCKAFRAKGHEAFSCDIIPCSGGHPEWHIIWNATDVINGGIYKLQDENAGHYYAAKWDLIIAHPPCTRLTVTANKWYKPEFADRFPNIHNEREEAIKFFMSFVNADCDKIAIENPVGIMSSKYRKPDQYIQPYQFGDKAIKKTGLWLKGLPLLIPTQIVEPEFVIYNAKNKKSGKSKYPVMWSGKHTAQERSKTFQGIADAMANQWG